MEDATVAHTNDAVKGKAEGRTEGRDVGKAVGTPMSAVEGTSAPQDAHVMGKLVRRVRTSATLNPKLMRPSHSIPVWSASVQPSRFRKFCTSWQAMVDAVDGGIQGGEGDTSLGRLEGLREGKCVKMWLSGWEGIRERRIEGPCEGRAVGRTEGRREGRSEGRSLGSSEDTSEGISEGILESTLEGAKKGTSLIKSLRRTLGLAEGRTLSSRERRSLGETLGSLAGALLGEFGSSTARCVTFLDRNWRPSTRREMAASLRGWW